MAVIGGAAQKLFKERFSGCHALLFWIIPYLTAGEYRVYYLTSIVFTFKETLMGTSKKIQSSEHVTLTLDAEHAKTLLTALTHALHGGGPKTELRRTKEKEK